MTVVTRDLTLPVWRAVPSVAESVWLTAQFHQWWDLGFHLWGVPGSSGAAFLAYLLVRSAEGKITIKRQRKAIKWQSSLPATFPPVYLLYLQRSSGHSLFCLGWPYPHTEPHAASHQTSGSHFPGFETALWGIPNVPDSSKQVRVFISYRQY